MLILLAAETTEPHTPPIWWTYFGGPVAVGAVLSGIFATIQTAINKKKTKPDIFEQTQVFLKGLQDTVDTLMQERAAEADRAQRLQQRIEELEKSTAEDFKLIQSLRQDLHMKEREINIKSQFITELAQKLHDMSIIVEGLEETYMGKLKFKEKHND